LARPTRRADVAIAYAERYRRQLEEGDISKKQVARLMLAENPGVFANLEDARRDLRRITGAAGDPESSSNKGRKKGNYEFKSSIEHGLRSIRSVATSQEDFILEGENTVLILSDIHLPYHDEDALEIAVEHGKGADVVLINGDLLDFYKLSRFSQDPEAVGIAEELQVARHFFATIRRMFPESRILYKLGNHEDRLEKYLWTKAPELVGLPFTSLGNLICADDHGVEMIGTRQLIKLGRLNVVHGHEFGDSYFSPVNPARGLFLRAKCSILAGHNHQTSEHHENNVNGDAMACWSTGCLCELKPAYRPFAFTKWNHGFAMVETEADGSFTVHNHRIIGGKVH